MVVSSSFRGMIAGRTGTIALLLFAIRTQPSLSWPDGVQAAVAAAATTVAVSSDQDTAVWVRGTTESHESNLRSPNPHPPPQRHLVAQTQTQTQLQLYDANSNTKITDLTDGMVLYVSENPSMAALSLNVMAVVSGITKVQSVQFGWNDNRSFRIENKSPFCLCGNKGADLFPCRRPILGLGSHTITVTPYASKRARGTAVGVPWTIAFAIVATRPPPPPPPPPSPVVVVPPSSPVVVGGPPPSSPSSPVIGVGPPSPSSPVIDVGPPPSPPSPAKMPVLIPIKTPTKTPTKRPTKQPTNAPLPVITVSIPVLSDQEISSVLSWMQNKTIQLRTDFCWKNTYDRGVGLVISDCPSGKEKIGALCYTQCPAGYARDLFLDCYSVCPTVLADQGLYCRNAEYYNGAGYSALVGGRDGCEKDQGVGNCAEYTFSIWHPRCKPGFSNVGCCTCRPTIPDCPALGLDPGFDLSCAKRKEVADPTVLTCRSDQINEAGLCYTPCAATHYGVAFLCWTKCESSGLTDCGAACAKDSATCASSVVDQILAPILMAVNVATFGFSKRVSGAVDATSIVVKTVKGGTELVSGTSKLGIAFVKLVKRMQEARTTTKVTKVIQRKDPKTGEVKKQEKSEEEVDIDFTGLMEAYLNAYTDDFTAQTHPIISNELNKRFHVDTANYFKRLWADQQFKEMSKHNGFNMERFALEVAALVDPTGILDIVLAYGKPVCLSVAAFPI